tara:strand:- start:223 stop:357 length:135 start_codon:yes stop_codon:yes gene_type:complete
LVENGSIEKDLRLNYYLELVEILHLQMMKILVAELLEELEQVSR